MAKSQKGEICNI